MQLRQLAGPTFLCALFFCTSILAFHTEANAASKADFETQLAVQIVNEYRQLRSSCNDQKEHSRKMCYYRLRIGLWDYKEAKKTLAQKGIKTSNSTQVAHSL